MFFEKRRGNNVYALGQGSATFFELWTGFSLALVFEPALNKIMFDHANLLQHVSHHGTLVTDLGLLCHEKVLRPVRIMGVNGTRSVFIISVVPVTF